MERPALRSHRHRRDGLPRPRPDRRLDPRAGAGGAQRRRRGHLRRRRARRAPARRRGAGRRPAALEAPGDPGRQQGRLRRRHGAGGRLPRARPRRSARRVGHAGPEHRRPARPRHRGAARRGRPARGGGRRRAPGDRRAPQRRQVDARQQAAGRRARDRLRRRRDHARRDRPAAGGRRAQARDRRHRRPAPAVQGLGLGRVLHDAALPARGRARRRRRSSSATPTTGSPARTCGSPSSA